MEREILPVPMGLPISVVIPPFAYMRIMPNKVTALDGLAMVLTGFSKGKREREREREKKVVSKSVLAGGATPSSFSVLEPASSTAHLEVSSEAWCYITARKDFH